MKLHVYVSGGAGAESIRDPELGRITKKMLHAYLASTRPNIVVQKYPNKTTDIVILPNHVKAPSKTTASKLRSNYVQIIHWNSFRRMYLGGGGRRGGGAVGGQRNMLEQSLREEMVASQGTRRSWRLRKAKELLAKNSPRPSRTRGWGVDFPLRGRERQELHQRCGPKCFLGGSDLSFPICRRCVAGNCHGCAIDPRGVQAAYQRARQYGYDSIAQRADKLRRK